MYGREFYKITKSIMRDAKKIDELLDPRPSVSVNYVVDCYLWLSKKLEKEDDKHKKL